jgi:signal transduction histidine kinase
MEAVSNSIDSITERMGDRAAKDGQIVIRVIRDHDNEATPVIGLDVEDNGIGFTEANYRSFRTPDSRKKEAAGGKGVGRLAWLKVFSSIKVDSTYVSSPHTR